MHSWSHLLLAYAYEISGNLTRCNCLEHRCVGLVDGRNGEKMIQDIM